MKEDIHYPLVEGVTVAIAPDDPPDGVSEAAPLWRAYLINENNHALVNVLVASTGYGQMDGEQRRTSTLRQLIGEVPAQSAIALEVVDPQVFPLFNEFWVSYYKPDEAEIYDKRFTFVPDTIATGHLTPIPYLDREGILHS